MHKVSIIGSGYVGATAVYYIAEKNLADIVMVDVVEGLPQAKALDYLHAAPMRKYNVHISGTNDYQDIADSDVIVITAGIPRKPGMDRMDLMKINVDIAKKASQAIAEYAPNAVKKSVIGVGHGDKKQIHMMVKVLMPKATFNSDDAADALAIAICHAHNRVTLKRNIESV